VNEEDLKAERHPIGITFHFDQIDDATPSEPKYQYTFILNEQLNMKFDFEVI